MRDLELGRLVRALRRRRGWRQRDCASRAGVHRSTWSRLERGHFDQLSLGAIRSCLAVVEVRLDLLPRWRGADLDRLLDENHATLANTLHRRHESWGWTVRAEVSFNHYGDRGRVDLVGRHAATGTLLIVEIKTEITDVQQVLGSLDIKQRLAGVVAHEAGWAPPTRVGVLLLVAESTTNRRRVERLAPLFGRFGLRGRSAFGWLRQPVQDAEPMLAFAKLPPAHGRHRRRLAPSRVRLPAPEVSASAAANLR
jgi:transcriptional regulator with XRE-family HTH domain